MPDATVIPKIDFFEGSSAREGTGGICSEYVNFLPC